MHLHRMIALGTILALAACSGGGGTTAPKPVVKSTPAGTSSRTQIAQGTMEIHFPANVRRGTPAASQHVRPAAAAGRRPAYVNPLTGTSIDIYVDQNYVENVPISNTNGDGIQTVTVPFFSTNSDVAVVEFDPGRSKVLAVGETTGVSVTPGTNVNVTVQMQMNATGIAVTSNFDGSNATVYGTSDYFCYAAFASVGSPAQLYMFPADPYYTYVVQNNNFNSPAPVSGSGGFSSIVGITTSGSQAGTAHLAQTPLNFLYYTDAGNHDALATIAITNPAANAAFGDLSGNYPTINSLYQSGSPFTSITSNQYYSPIGDFLNTFNADIGPGCS